MSRLSIREAAQAANVSEKTLRRWIDTGRLVAEKIEGKKGLEYRIESEQLEIASAKPQKTSLSEPRRTASGQSQVLEDLRELAQRQAEALDALRAELAQSRGQVHDLTAQVAQLNDRVTRALPAPKAEPEPKRSFWSWLPWLKVPK